MLLFAHMLVGIVNAVRRGEKPIITVAFAYALTFVTTC